MAISLQRSSHHVTGERVPDMQLPGQSTDGDCVDGQVGALVLDLAAKAPQIWDMVGVGLWTCEPPVCMRLEFQYIREGSQKVIYLASGMGGPGRGQGVEIQLTRRVRRPEDYTGAYLGLGGDMKLRGVGYGIGGATGFPWGGGKPVGISIGLSSPGPTAWLCDYTIVGEW